MVNRRHLKILKQGVKAWNEWREENPGVRVDLGEADLAGANLSRATMGGTTSFTLATFRPGKATTPT